MRILYRTNSERQAEVARCQDCTLLFAASYPGPPLHLSSLLPRLQPATNHFPLPLLLLTRYLFPVWYQTLFLNPSWCIDATEVNCLAILWKTNHSFQLHLLLSILFHRHHPTDHTTLKFLLASWMRGPPLSPASVVRSDQMTAPAPTTLPISPSIWSRLLSPILLFWRKWTENVRVSFRKHLKWASKHWPS